MAKCIVPTHKYVLCNKLVGGFQEGLEKPFHSGVVGSGGEISRLKSESGITSLPRSIVTCCTERISKTGDSEKTTQINR